jgi:MftR C-terminal domain
VLWDAFDPLILDALRHQPAGLGPIAALRGAFREVLGPLAAAERAALRERLALVLSIPPVRAAGANQMGQPLRQLAEIVAGRVGRTPDDFAVRTLLGAVAGVCLAVLPGMAEDPDSDVVLLSTEPWRSSRPACRYEQARDRPRRGLSASRAVEAVSSGASRAVRTPQGQARRRRPRANPPHGRRRHRRAGALARPARRAVHRGSRPGRTPVQRGQRLARRRREDVPDALRRFRHAADPVTSRCGRRARTDGDATWVQGRAHQRTDPRALPGPRVVRGAPGAGASAGRADLYSSERAAGGGDRRLLPRISCDGGAGRSTRARTFSG